MAGDGWAVVKVLAGPVPGRWGGRKDHTGGGERRAAGSRRGAPWWCGRAAAIYVGEFMQRLLAEAPTPSPSAGRLLFGFCRCMWFRACCVLDGRCLRWKPAGAGDSWFCSRCICLCSCAATYLWACCLIRRRRRAALEIRVGPVGGGPWWRCACRPSVLP